MQQQYYVQQNPQTPLLAPGPVYGGTQPYPYQQHAYPSGGYVSPTPYGAPVQYSPPGSYPVPGPYSSGYQPAESYPQPCAAPTTGVSKRNLYVAIIALIVILSIGVGIFFIVRKQHSSSSSSSEPALTGCPSYTTRATCNSTTKDSCIWCSLNLTCIDLYSTCT
ncbi:hypothetical protein PROFUN_07459 [Planoprotostelium fungivorum]|uniref:Uncharacterized protein n=1 Tax=Planoprotostelium fungivorum TaxID=1890364 RepID=A0A2P6NLF9_9EUKA|nr:hypothetical protein PROFUN_07459 [Planoprotostelium fungivorum]